MQIRWSGMDFPETVMSCQTICGGAGECFTMMLANFESHFGCFSTPGVCKLTFKYSWIVHKTSPIWQFDTRQTDFSTVIGHETQLQPKTGVVTHGKVSNTNRLNKESAHLNRIVFVMPSCQGHAFHVAGLFLGESSGYWWFPPPPPPPQMASDADLWCFVWCQPDKSCWTNSREAGELRCLDGQLLGSMVQSQISATKADKNRIVRESHQAFRLHLLACLSLYCTDILSECIHVELLMV